MSDRDDTPPDRDMVGQLVRLSAELGDVTGYLKRHQNDITNLRQDLHEFRDQVLHAIPKIEDLTGRVKVLEGAERLQDREHTRWRGFFAGVVAMAALTGGVVGALAAAGVFH